jgi:hypothetical protein
MGAVNLVKIVEKHRDRDLLKCERCKIFGNVRGEKEKGK